MKLSIEILCDGVFKPLVLDDSIKISLTLFNPMFNSQGTYSLSSSIPRCTTNDVLLKFAHRIQYNNSQYLEIDCRLMFDNIVLYHGILSVDESSNDDYEFSLAIGLGMFASNIRDKSLIELSFRGDVKITGVDAYTDQEVYDILSLANTDPNADYVLPTMYSPAFYEKIDGQFLTYHYNTINKWCFEEQKLKSTFYDSISIFLYLKVILKYIFHEHGFFISENIFTEDADLRKLILYNNYDQKKNNGKSINTLNYKNLVPDIKISDFIKNLQYLFGVVFFVDSKFLTVRVKTLKSIITDNSYIDITSIADKKNTVYHEKTSGYKLVRKIADDDNYVKDNTDKTEIDAIYTLTVDKYSDLPTNPQTSMLFTVLYYVKSESNYYYFETEEATDSGLLRWWRKVSSELSYKADGDEELEIETNIASLDLYTHLFAYDFDLHGGNVVADIQYTIPRTDQSITTIAIKTQKNKFAAKLLFYHGLQKCIDTENNPRILERYLKYPFASYDVYDALCNKIEDANLSLSYWGEYGIYEKFYKEYIYWYLNIRKRVKRVINFSLSDILNLDFTRKYRIENVNYLISEVKIEITANDIKTVDCELFSC